MGNHSLNPNIANKYGPICALILQNIFYWINENKKNNKESTHFHEGKWWTYSSVRELSEHFTYLTTRQIRTALDTLKENELVLTANFNNTCNRTLWYTVTQKATDIMNSQEEIQEDFSTSNDETIIEEEINAPESGLEVQKCQNDLSYRANGFDIQGKTICHTRQMDLTPVTNHTNNKPQNITTNNIEKEIYKEKEPPDEVIFNFWNSKQLINADELNNYLRTVISNLLKFFTLETVLLAISRYAEIYHSNNFFDYGWKFKEFLKAEKINKFLDNGEHWINYCNWKKKQQATSGFIHNSYTPEQIASLVTNLDELEV